MQLISVKSKQKIEDIINMLTLSAQTVSLVTDDFSDLSIRNDISYGAHKVSMQMLMTSHSFFGMLRAS